MDEDKKDDSTATTSGQTQSYTGIHTGADAYSAVTSQYSAVTSQHSAGTSLYSAGQAPGNAVSAEAGIDATAAETGPMAEWSRKRVDRLIADHLAR